MQERDRSAEPKTDEQVRRRNWLEEAQRRAVELQLCLAHAAEEEGLASELQPLGSDIVASSEYQGGLAPRLTLTIPEWPPKLRPHEAGSYAWTHIRDVRLRWEAMVQRALQAGAFKQGYFRPYWREATVFFSFHVPQADPGDPDHFALSFVINALRKSGVITGDSWENLYIGGIRSLRASPGGGKTVVTVVPGRLWFEERATPEPMAAESPGGEPDVSKEEKNPFWDPPGELGDESDSR